MFFFMIVGGIPICAIAWWWWAHRRLRAVPHARWWQWGVAAFVLGHTAALAWLLAARFTHTQGPPPTLVASTYIWSLVLLPFTAMLTFGLVIAIGAVRTARALRQPPTATAQPPAPTAALTRRQALGNLAMVGAPMVAQSGALTRGLSQLDEFRVRHIDVTIPSLPPALDGLTIAHVSDTHVGRFTRGPVLAAVARRVCELDCDLVCFSGDLIDYSMADLPEALAMMRDLRARHGVFTIEGNHDLFEDRDQFRRRVRQAEIGLLVNETATIHIRGQPVQLLGLRWGDAVTHVRGALFEQNIEEMSRRLDPAAFPILLSHHPHVFDEAARLGIPLTLAGHTHGGQLNFMEGIGLVQYMFRYMSGLYTQPGAAGAASCVVSNGVGNWFPLRVNAPAEVIKITLRRTSS